MVSRIDPVLLCKKDFTYRQVRPNQPDTVFVSRLPEDRWIVEPRGWQSCARC
jgi:hypothetical protein